MTSERPVGGAWRMWRAGGVDYLVKPSLLVMGAILVAVFAERFDGRTTNPVVLAIGFVVGLYVSVLLHEIAHVIAARRFGLHVRSVTLHLMGGETAIEGDSRTPAQELVTAGVGPFASFAIALVCRWLEGPTSGSAADLLWTIGTVNLFVAVFNLLPALPLDGGRVLRAIIWATTGNEAVGIKVAAWIGRALAVVMVIGFGIAALNDAVALVHLAIAVLLAVFIWMGAAGHLRRADRASRVNRLYARELAHEGEVTSDALSLDADLHGILLLREIAARPADVYAVKEPDGTVVGVLTLDDIDQAYRAHRSGETH